jgi:two-component system response regulator
MSNEEKSIKLLLVEDNPGDVRLIQEAMRENNFELHVVRDGMEALDFLFRRGKFEAVEKPDLIILDLNLPKKDGREVLKEIKNDRELKRIPVIVLTTSNAKSDIIKTYASHANCFITKPTGLDQFMKVMHAIEQFWLEIVELPTRED